MGGKSKYPWTSVGAYIKVEYEEGASTSALALRYSIPRQSIADYLRKSGLLRSFTAAKKNQRGFDYEVTGPLILRDYTDGESPRNLAQKYSVSYAMVEYFLRRHGKTRDKKRAAILRHEKGRKGFKPRHCSACNKPFIPASPRHACCRVCTPDKTAERRYTSKRITQPEWDRLLAEQHGTCALCDRPATVVDHDHKTLVVRGLLCHGCNSAMNRVDVPGWTRRAVAYLKRNTGHHVNPAFQAAWNRGSARRRAGL